MLSNLRTALGAWKPLGGASTDPLITIRSAWSEMVGEQFARNAQPVAIRGTALIVVTPSSAWNAELAFLERSVLAGIAALGVRGIERLRFRVGTVRAPAAGGTAQRGSTRPPGRRLAVEGKPATLDEAVARLRAVVETRRAAHAAAGGAFCAICAASIPGGAERCVPCAERERRERRERCERILFQAPWLGPGAVREAVPGLSERDYERIRRDLLRGWYDELRLARKRHDAKAPIDAVRVRQVASSFVLLHTGADPNRLELDSAVRQNALGDLYPFIRTVETQE